MTEPARLDDHKPGERWPEATIQRGLQALAVSAGNTRAAADRIKAAGFEVPRESLRHWMTVTHVEEYARARRDYREALIAELWEELSLSPRHRAREATD